MRLAIPTERFFHGFYRVFHRQPDGKMKLFNIYFGSRGSVLDQVLRSDDSINEYDLELEPVEDDAPATECRTTTTECRDNLSHHSTTEIKRPMRRKGSALF